MSLHKEFIVKIDKSLLRKVANQNYMKPIDLLYLISDVLQETYQLVKEDIQKWILKYVPKRTGQLRFTLLKALEKSKIRSGIIKFIIGTHVEYAQAVNEMSTANVRHHGTHFEHSGKRAYAYYYTHKSTRKKRKAKRKTGVSQHRIFLNDPMAIGGFWEKLLSYFQKRILFHMANSMRKHYGSKKAIPWVLN